MGKPTEEVLGARWVMKREKPSERLQMGKPKER